MLHKKTVEVEARPVETEGANDISMRLLISEDDGAPNFQMRLFEVESGGNSPFHSHPWEHEAYIVSGRGSVKTGEGDVRIETDDVVFVRPGEPHSFQADAGQPLRFICCVPIQSG